MADDSARAAAEAAVAVAVEMGAFKPAITAAAAAAKASALAALAVWNTAGAAVIAAEAAYDKNWLSVMSDAKFLLSAKGEPVTQALSLLAQDLWQGVRRNPLINTWSSSSRKLELEGLSFWVDWYNRRLVGHATGFALSLENDLIIQSRLLEQDDEWWTKRDFVEVTAEIEGWVRELVAQERPDTLPEQNIYAITVKVPDEGPLILDSQAGADLLSHADQDQIRYLAAKEEAESLKTACLRSNAGGTLGRRLDQYLAAMGNDLSGIEPNMVVLYGQAIRDILTAQEVIKNKTADDDGYIPPLASDIILELQMFRSAHNLMVVMDPELEKRDKALYGSNYQSVEISLTVIQQVIVEAGQSNIVDQNVQEAISDAAESAKTESEPQGQRYRFALESLRNVVKGVAAWAWKHKGPITAGSCGLYAAAQWVKSHQQWLLEVFADNPAMIEWVNKIASQPWL